MYTFTLYIKVQIVDELTISPPHKKMREARTNPGFFACPLLFLLFRVAKPAKME